MSRLRLFAGAGVLLWVNSLYAQEAIHEVQWSPEHFAFPQLSSPTLIEVPAVESRLLDPRSTWSDPEAYDRKARELARMFRDNFERYADDASDETMAAGPRV